MFLQDSLDIAGDVWQTSDMAKKTAKKAPFSIYLDPSLLKDLQEWSAETGAPIAELVRRALRAAVEVRKGKKK